MTFIKNAFNKVVINFGMSTRESFERLGSISILFLQVLRSRPRYHLLIEQFIYLGISSLPIVILAAIFVGFIATWQVKYLAGDMVGLNYLGMVVLKVVMGELGPTLIGLVLAGRVGAKLAAEVGTMRVTEQIDAMTCLSLNPISYVVAPRVISGFIIFPVLFIFGSLSGIVSSQILATVALELHPYTFYNSMRIMFNINIIYMGLIKSCMFGGIITLCGCYFGYNTAGGAVGVGTSTRRAVVAGSILILLGNLIISELMM